MRLLWYLDFHPRKHLEVNFSSIIVILTLSMSPFLPYVPLPSLSSHWHLYISLTLSPVCVSMSPPCGVVDYLLLLVASLQWQVFEEENRAAVRLLAGENVEISRCLDPSTLNQYTPVSNYLHCRSGWRTWQKRQDSTPSYLYLIPHQKFWSQPSSVSGLMDNEVQATEECCPVSFI